MLVSMPGSAYLGLFLSHWSNALEDAETLSPDERGRLARQLMVLHAAATMGAPPHMDDIVTDQRELLDLALQRLGYEPTDEDRALTVECVFRADDLRSAIRKLLAAA